MKHIPYLLTKLKIVSQNLQKEAAFIVQVCREIERGKYLDSKLWIRAAVQNVNANLIKHNYFETPKSIKEIWLFKVPLYSVLR